jgi:threonine dehydrogenase-like Zn-dependent dehydrogenase
MTQVRAAVLTGPGKLEIQEFPRPRLEPHQALIRMELSGICGTDKHCYKGEGLVYAGTMMETTPHFPIIPGHENVGVIDEIGGVARDRLEFSGRPLAPGDRVVMCPDVVCGHCWYCRNLHGMGWCETQRCYGMSLTSDVAPHLFGGWAEYMIVDTDVFVYKVPTGMSAELAVLVEPMVVTATLEKAKELHTSAREGFTAGDTLVIQGVGPLGLFHVIRARMLGAGSIIAVDVSPERLAMATRFGATTTLRADESTAEERVQAVRDLTEGRGADVAVDCAGVPEVLPEGLEMLRKGGTYIECGAFVEMGPVPISPHRHLASKSVRLLGSTNHPYTGYDGMLRQMEIYGDALDLTSIITDSYPIADAEAALLRSMELSSGKVVIDART